MWLHFTFILNHPRWGGRNEWKNRPVMHHCEDLLYAEPYCHWNSMIAKFNFPKIYCGCATLHMHTRSGILSKDSVQMNEKTDSIFSIFFCFIVSSTNNTVQPSKWGNKHVECIYTFIRIQSDDDKWLKSIVVDRKHRKAEINGLFMKCVC